MIFRFFLLLIGFGFTVLSGVTLIAYLNIVATGHGMATYFSFILHQPEFYIFFLGIFLITCSIYLPLRIKK